MVALVIVAELAARDLQASFASALYLLVALYGLHLLSVYTQQPSLGQGAFLAVGAYGTALLRVRWGVDGLLAAGAAAAGAAALGYVVGRAAAGLRPATLALSTWALGWLVYLLVTSFPDVTGGVSGLQLPPLRERIDALGIDLTFDARAHLVTAAILLALTLLLLRSALLSHLGRGWAALRDSRSLAGALGYDVAALRVAAFAASAGLAGLAGSLLAQQSGVVDPKLYDPAASLALLIAVLVGRPAGFAGPVVGMVLLFELPAGIASSGFFGIAPGPLQDTLTALFALVALVFLGARQELGLQALFRLPAAGAAPPAETRPPAAASAPLRVEGVRVSFGGLQALAGVDLELAAGRIHGLVGPNGSGKTTLLRCIAGVARPDSGRVLLGGEPLDGLSQPGRVRAGVARSFQRTVVLPELTCGDHVLAGRQAARAALRAIFKTPRYRAERTSDQAAVRAVLEMLGLGELTNADPRTISAGRQRLLQIGAALGTEPRLLLLDEPSAGMRPDELALLEASLRRLRDSGVTVVVVEHNLRFLRRIADTVTVLSEGAVLAQGHPASVLRLARVRRAYGILAA